MASFAMRPSYIALTLCLIVSTLCGLSVSSPLLTTEKVKAEEPVVVVEGMVYCQSCELKGTHSLAEAKPIAGAKVGVACKDEKGRVKWYQAHKTDSYGYFYASVIGFAPSMDALSSCTAYLLSSPDPECNLLTNINGGFEGSPLRYKGNLKAGKVLLYATGPLAFRPARCHPLSHY
ncbi:hypothetical protein AMTRI_Chr08g166380 [Amborella trichopoda]